VNSPLWLPVIESAPINCLIKDDTVKEDVFARLLSLGLPSALFNEFYQKGRVMHDALNGDIAKRSSLKTNPRYEVKGTFKILPMLCVKTFWGTRNKPLRLPDISSDVTNGEGTITNGSIVNQYVGVSLAFLKSREGQVFFESYLKELRYFNDKYGVKYDTQRTNYFLFDWSVSIIVQDSTAPSGERDIGSWGDLLDVVKLENMIKVLARNPAKSNQLVVINDANIDDVDAYDDRFLSFAEYMAVEGEKVIVHYADYNDESFIGADEVLHQVELDRKALAKQLKQIHQQIKLHIEAVAETVNVNIGELGYLK